MHIGLIVGIGPAATDYYYRSLMAASAQAGQALTLTMAHADLQMLLRNQSENNVDAQVAIYCELARRLQSAGSEQLAITSIAGHFCVDAFKAVSPIPVIDLLDAVRLEVRRRGLRRVGLLGTRRVMESKFYGVLDGVDVVAPANLSEVHDAYVAMAAAGVALPGHRAVFLNAGRALTQVQGCESVLLAGTDLALVFRDGDNAGFATLDCAAVHAAAIATIANG